MILYDQLNRKLKIKTSPKRIVSLVPSQTELLVDLGLEDYIVGITKFCVHPKRLLTQKQIIGGTKSVHFDRIAALNPDIILCNKEENTQEIVERCSSIAAVHVSDIKTLEDNNVMISQYGKILDAEEEASRIITNINDSLESFLTHKSKERLTVAYFIWRKPWMVAGSDTFINSLLHIAGFDNAFACENRYPEISLLELKEKNVEKVLLSSEPFPFKKKYIDEFSEYASKENIHIVDGEYFSWYGSRLIKAFTYFGKLRTELLN